MKYTIPVSSVMTTDVSVVTPDQKLIDIKHIFEKKKFHHHIPVVKGEKVVGIISLYDYLRAVKDASLDDTENVYHSLTAKDIMSEHVLVKSPHATVKEIAREFSSNMVHAIPIVKDGKLEGIVSVTDLVKLMAEE